MDQANRVRRRLTITSTTSLEDDFIEIALGRAMFRGVPSLLEMDARDIPSPPEPEQQHHLHLQFNIRRPECVLCQQNTSVSHPEPPREYEWQKHVVKDPKPLPPEVVAAVEKTENVIAEKKVEALARDQKQDQKKAAKSPHHHGRRGNVSSPFRGVSELFRGKERVKVWMSYIVHGGRCEGRRIFPGTPDGEKSAAVFRDLTVRRLGLNVLMNFPDLSTDQLEKILANGPGSLEGPHRKFKSEHV
jgi:hypothetical protein